MSISDGSRSSVTYLYNTLNKYINKHSAKIR